MVDVNCGYHANVATALLNFLTYEYMQSDWSKDQPNPLRHDLVKEPIEVFADGYMQLPPEKPGRILRLERRQPLIRTPPATLGSAINAVQPCHDRNRSGRR